MAEDNKSIDLIKSAIQATEEKTRESTIEIQGKYIEDYFKGNDMER